jgi:hypothetical protein
MVARTSSLHQRSCLRNNRIVVPVTMKGRAGKPSCIMAVVQTIRAGVLVQNASTMTCDRGVLLHFGWKVVLHNGGRTDHSSRFLYKTRRPFAMTCDQGVLYLNYPMTVYQVNGSNSNKITNLYPRSSTTRSQYLIL